MHPSAQACSLWKDPVHTCIVLTQPIKLRLNLSDVYCINLECSVRYRNLV